MLSDSSILPHRFARFRLSAPNAARLCLVLFVPFLFVSCHTNSTELSNTTSLDEPINTKDFGDAVDPANPLRKSPFIWGTDKANEYSQISIQIPVKSPPRPTIVTSGFITLSATLIGSNDGEVKVLRSWLHQTDSGTTALLYYKDSSGSTDTDCHMATGTINSPDGKIQNVITNFRGHCIADVKITVPKDNKTPIFFNGALLLASIPENIPYDTFFTAFGNEKQDDDKVDLLKIYMGSYAPDESPLTAARVASLESKISDGDTQIEALKIIGKRISDPAQLGQIIDVIQANQRDQAREVLGLPYN